MIALILLVVVFLSIPSNPVIAALALWGATGAAKSWTAEGEDVVAMVFFYGALIGCLTVWLS